MIETNVMQPDLLRLLLIAVGVTLVIGIYVADKLKRRRKEIDQEDVRKEPSLDSVDSPAWNHDVYADKEIDSNILSGSPVHEKTGEDKEVDAIPEQLGIIDKVFARKKQEDTQPAPLELNEWDAVEQQGDLDLSVSEEVVTEIDADPAYTLDMNFNAHGESDHVTLDPDLYDDLPRKIIQINVVSHTVPFTGSSLFKAAKDVEMQYGDMDIFHRIETLGKPKVLFSMVNMVEPGTFPKDAKARKGFSSPGVTLFTQLPAVRDGIAIYSDMLFTAERLAAILGGELQDEFRSALTKQTIEHTRESILQHRHQVNVFRSRHHQ